MRGWLLGTAAALAFGGLAAAQEAAPTGEAVDAAAVTVVDPLSVIATRTEKPLSETPATVSVITDEEIEENLYFDIKDLVRYEPGVSVQNSPARFGAALGTTGRDGAAGFNIRGLDGNRVLIQVDGVRVPDAFTFGAQATGRGDYGGLQLIKKVEILRGPASALYGSDGVAGAVSFVTKDPADYLRSGDLGGMARGAYASADESWTGGLVAAARQGRWSGMLAYSRREGAEQENQGEVFTADTDRTAANPQDWASGAVLAKLVFDLSQAHRFRLAYEHFDRESDADVLSNRAKPPLGSTSVLRLLAHDETDRDRVSFDHVYDGEAGLISRLRWNLYWQASQNSQFSDEDRNTAADRTRLNTFDNAVIGGGFEVRSVLGAHDLIWGADYSRTRQEGVRDGTVPPTGESFPTRAFPSTDYSLLGVFVQDELALADGRLTVYPALRYDWYDLDPEVDALLPGFTPKGQGEGRLSPKLGVVWEASETVNLFANYAQGFKAPAPSQVNNFFENLIFGYRSEPNPDLKPETSETYEIGIKMAAERWSAGLTLFTASYDDFIEQVQVSGTFAPGDPGVFQFVNLGEVDIYGGEVKAQGRLENGLGGVLALSYAKGEAATGGVTEPLDSIDPVKVVAGLTYDEPAGRYGGQFIVTHSEGKTVGRTTCNTCFLPPDFTVLDLTAYWNITDQVRLNAGVFNLTDETYWWWNDVRGLAAASTTRDAYTQPGRNYAVSLTFTY